MKQVFFCFLSKIAPIYQERWSKFQSDSKWEVVFFFQKVSLPKNNTFLSNVVIIFLIWYSHWVFCIRRSLCQRNSLPSFLLSFLTYIIQFSCFNIFFLSFDWAFSLSPFLLFLNGKHLVVRVALINSNRVEHATLA